MQNRVINKKDFVNFVDELIKTQAAGEVIGIKEKENKFAFDTLVNASELRLDYDISLLPPKQFFLPPTETVIKFKLDTNPTVKPVVSRKPICIIGVHPFDIHGILLCDAVYGGSIPDPNYLLKRSNSVIIGVDCLKPNAKSFAASMGTATIEKGFDLMLTDIGKEYFITMGTSKGENLLNKYAEIRDAAPADQTKRDAVRKESLKQYQVSLKINPAEIPALLDANWDNALFKEKSATCFSCGSCVMVCPTCVCFDVQDNLSLNLKEGERYRRWDGCMLSQFAKVASGENFREHKEQRFRHRMYRKGKYLIERYNQLGCVGCGRCAIACLAEIASPAETFNALKEKR